MSLFSRKQWIAITLASTSFLFAEGKSQRQQTISGYDPAISPVTAAYNAPSRVQLLDRWDLFFSGNFIYWNASEENLELGVVSDTSNALYSVNGNIVNQDFTYAPGFQIGLGGNLNRDHWDVFFQYTWFRNTDTVTTSLDAASGEVLYPFLSLPDVANPTYLWGEEKWHLAMDIIDAEIGRSYYVGTALTFRPFFGARSAFIRQSLDVDYRNETTQFLNFRNVSVDQTTHSWGIGLRGGVNMSWCLGKGVRMYGDGSADLLFTQYTKLRWDQQATNAAGATPTGGLFTLRQKDLNYLRPHAAFELGFGWGDYFYSRKFHFDISAGYGFQVFFNQNMFRAFMDDQGLHGTLPNGDLFIHGMTASTRFDF